MKKKPTASKRERVFHSMEEFERAYFPHVGRKREESKKEIPETGFAQQFLERVKKELERQST
ncbi:hypothetical protein WMF11_22470 [Sorangium sp. So ce295]|uniref:hypothetical protein n=1 Tax=Sorangium sp. So ce295 TaxID=3133295 RepID=UPI003F636D0E